MHIDRRSDISELEFIENYLRPGIPVVITDAMNSWDLERFTPEALGRDFGDEFVQVYDDLFTLQNVQTLEDYLNENFNQSESTARCQRYIRWYTQLKDVEFMWADHVFEQFKDAWKIPYFLPSSSFIIPFAAENQVADPTEIQFPYKGLFISGRGSRTRLHRDPWSSSAVLCQFYGQKKIYLYSREQTEYVTNGKGFVDPLNPDLNAYPDFNKAELLAEEILSPGEIIFFPGGTFHDVTSMSDSVSITWNFLHSSNLNRFCNHVEKHPQEGELEIVRYFLKQHLPGDATAEQILDFARKHYADQEVTPVLETECV